MHPRIHSDRPGSCSICGMDLVLETGQEGGEHEHGEVEEHGIVQLSPGKQQMIGIVTAEVEKRELFKSIRLPGRVAFDPELYTAQSEYLNAPETMASGKKISQPFGAGKHSSDDPIFKNSLESLGTIGWANSGIEKEGTADRRVIGERSQSR